MPRYLSRNLQTIIQDRIPSEPLKMEGKYMASNLNADRVASLQLIRALENTIQAQRSLGLGYELMLKQHSLPLLNQKTKKDSGKTLFQNIDETSRGKTYINELIPENLTTVPTVNTSDTPPSEREIQLESMNALQVEIRKGNSKRAFDLYKLSLKNLDGQQPLEQTQLVKEQLDMYASLIILLIPTNLEEAFEVFLRYKSIHSQATTDQNVNKDSRLKILHRVIEAVGHESINSTLSCQKYRSIVHGLREMVMGLPSSQRDILLLKLVDSILKIESPDPSLRSSALKLWDTIEELHKKGDFVPSKNNGTLDKLTSLLNHSKFWKQDALPFWKILEMAVDHGSQPKPKIALNILQNMYPFTTIYMVRSVLKSIICLQKNKAPQELNYQIDQGTLECISVGASRHAASNVILLLWDYMELIGTASVAGDDRATCLFEPTEGMYEDAVYAFVSSKWKKDHFALSILTEMEERGYKAKRSLIRSVSRKLSASVGRVNNALYLLKNSFEDGGDNIDSDNSIGIKPSTSSLNSVLSAYAQIGRVDKAFKTYDDFDRFNCSVNQDTFEYLMESLVLDAYSATPICRVRQGGNGHKRIEYATQYQNRGGEYEEWMASLLDSGEVILTTAKERNVELSQHFLHNYIKLLCVAGEVDKAFDLLRELLHNEDGENSNCILMETFTLLSMSFARLGQKDKADTVTNMSLLAGYKNGLPSYALDRIETLKN